MPQMTLLDQVAKRGHFRRTCFSSSPPHNAPTGSARTGTRQGRPSFARDAATPASFPVSLALVRKHVPPSHSARPFPIPHSPSPTTTMGKHKHKHRVRVVLSDLEEPEFSLGALLGRSNSTGEDAR